VNHFGESMDPVIMAIDLTVLAAIAMMPAWAPRAIDAAVSFIGHL